MEVDDQACSNVLAHCWRPSIGRAGAGEAPVRDEISLLSLPSSPPGSRGVLHLDDIRGWPFCWVTVALGFDTKDEDTPHHLVVRAEQQKVKLKNSFRQLQM